MYFMGRLRNGIFFSSFLLLLDICMADKACYYSFLAALLLYLVCSTLLNKVWMLYFVAIFICASAVHCIRVYISKAT